MEARLMRLSMLILTAAALLASGGAQAGGRCNLDSLVGYQVVFAKPIVAYIQNGKKTIGYEGCEPDRVLVFGDNSGVRCVELNLQHLDDPPTGFLFGKTVSDLKLCVEGELFSVLPTN